MIGQPVAGLDHAVVVAVVPAVTHRTVIDTGTEPGPLEPERQGPGQGEVDGVREHLAGGDVDRVADRRTGFLGDVVTPLLTRVGLIGWGGRLALGFGL